MILVDVIFKQYYMIHGIGDMQPYYITKRIELSSDVQDVCIM